MKKFLSRRQDSLPQEKGGMADIMKAGDARERAGKKVYHMEIGRPDFDTPKPIKDAAIKALENGDVHYTDFDGVLELRQAIAKREKNKGGLEFDPESEIMITVGGGEALYCIFVALLDSEDEVLIPSPYYSSYAHQIVHCGGKYVDVPVIKDGKMDFNIDDFKSKLTKNTKVLIVNNPNNPIGYVLSDENLQELADFAIENDLIVISDEVYDDYIFEGKFKSISTLPGMRDRTIVVNSVSKAFSMTGWRIGYVAGNADLMRPIGDIQSHITTCATSFAQAGAVLAYNEIYDEVKEMIGEYQKRKDYVAKCLRKIEGISFVEPKGAFYVFMDISKLGISGTEFCAKLIEKTGVALTPGSGYGEAWTNYVRLAYVISMEDLKEAMGLFEKFVSELK